MYPNDGLGANALTPVKKDFNPKANKRRLSSTSSKSFKLWKCWEWGNRYDKQVDDPMDAIPIPRGGFGTENLISGTENDQLSSKENDQLSGKENDQLSDKANDQFTNIRSQTADNKMSLMPCKAVAVGEVGCDNITPPTVHVEILPEDLSLSTCGAYVARDKQGIKGVFKPTIEEGKQEGGAALKRGVEWGQSTVKEIAAWFLGEHVPVPHTCHATAGLNGRLVQGSFQRYVEHQGTAEDVGANSFHVEDIQKIAILDLRILNLDRHGGNLLVKRTQPDVASRRISWEHSALIPIDHGFCLPDYKDLSDIYFGWTYWKQACQQWSKESLATIASFDPVAEAKSLLKLGISHGSVVSAYFSTLLLQQQHLSSVRCPFDCAMLMQRSHTSEDPSPFERALSNSELPPSTSHIWPWVQNAECNKEEWEKCVERFLSFFN